jgi:hypothetical protein
MSIRERILAVYKNQRPESRPVSIYKRYLKVGELERSARNSGLGILDFVPVVSLLAPAWHLAPGYISDVKCFTVYLLRLAKRPTRPGQNL